MSREINLIGGFYEAKSLPFSAQDTVNWLPVPSRVEGSRSPIKLRGVPGLTEFGEDSTPNLVLTGDAPDGFVGDAYSYTYSASGGMPPYVFTISSGTLPPTTTISASTSNVSGTLTAAGLYSFTVRVTDAAANLADLPDTVLVTLPLENQVEYLVATYVSDSNLTGNVQVNIPASWQEGDVIAMYVSKARNTLGSPTNDLPEFDGSATLQLAYNAASFGVGYLRLYCDWYTLSATAISDGFFTVNIGGSLNSNGVFHFVKIPRQQIAYPLSCSANSYTTGSGTAVSTGGTFAIDNVTGYTVSAGKALRIVHAGANVRNDVALTASGDGSSETVVALDETRRIGSAVVYDQITVASSYLAGSATYGAATGVSGFDSIGGICQVITIRPYDQLMFPVSVSQSSIASGCVAATVESLNDGMSTTGTRINAIPGWIQCDLGSERFVGSIGLRIGVIGGVTAEADGFELQYSNNGSSWTTELTVSGVNTVDDQLGSNSFTVNRTARYWRCYIGSGTGNFGLAEFRFYTE